MRIEVKVDAIEQPHAIIIAIAFKTRSATDVVAKYSVFVSLLQLTAQLADTRCTF